MSACSKCQPAMAAAGRLHLCSRCFEGWPKGYTLHEYLGMHILPQPPRAKTLPYMYKPRP